MTLGEKIQKLRKQRGLSQEALAEKVTVTRQTFSKINSKSIWQQCHVGSNPTVCAKRLLHKEKIQVQQPLYG